MVLDLRKHAKKDLLSLISLIHINETSMGGFKPVSLIAYQGDVFGNSSGVINLISVHEKIDGDYFNFGLSFIREKVNGDITSALGVTNVKGNVYGSALSLPFGFTIVGNDVNEHMGSFLGYSKVGNDAKKSSITFFGINKIGNDVHNNIFALFGLTLVGNDVYKNIESILGINIVKGTVHGDDEGMVGIFSYTGRVNGKQSGYYIGIQKSNKRADQNNLISYNPLEKIVFGSSVYNKIRRAKNYFDELRRYDPIEYTKTVLNYADKKERKTIFGHRTYNSILIREAKKRKKELGEILKKYIQ